MRPQRVQIPRVVIRDLKQISDLSSKNKWEYAGAVGCKIKGKTASFSKPTFVTSKNRRKVTLDSINTVWPSLITYHTHPAIVQPQLTNRDDTKIFATLPSNSDFEVCIFGFPSMQINMICDAHGYYVIDMLQAVKNEKIPISSVVNGIMNKFRQRSLLKEWVFSEDGLEYFETTLTQWKRLINLELNQHLNKLFGISIRYYAYSDHPPIITIDLDSI
jgi:hypothetical protein